MILLYKGFGLNSLFYIFFSTFSTFSTFRKGRAKLFYIYFLPLEKVVPKGEAESQTILYLFSTFRKGRKRSGEPNYFIYFFAASAFGSCSI